MISAGRVVRRRKLNACTDPRSPSRRKGAHQIDQIRLGLLGDIGIGLSIFSYDGGVTIGPLAAPAWLVDGVAVLRFDFTGLGGSGGDFSNTGFTSNIGDLVAAVAEPVE